MLSDRAKTIAVSIGFHAGIGAILATFAVTRLGPARDDEPVDVTIVELDEEVPEEEIEPEQVPPLDVPTEKRPVVVPKETRVVVVEKPKPFQENAIDPGIRDAPDDAEAVPMPTAPPTFEMEATVGGGNADFESTTVAGGDVGIAAPGPAGGAPGAVGNQGAVGIKVSKDWQVTSLPNPTNDRDFEPGYPPLAKREGREAAIRLELQIDTSGHVAHATVLAGLRGHGFRRSAVAYAKRLRFDPARSGKRAVAARIEWTVYFYARN